VDFRALQLLNIYDDDNAYTDVTPGAAQRARCRRQVTLTMRREVGIENLLGRENSFTLSGEQWGAWNATFSLAESRLARALWTRHWQNNHLIAERCKNTTSAWQ